MSHATGGRESQGVLGDIDDLKGWEDDEDPEDCYAVYRGKINDHSFHLVDIMNEFGRCGGFDALTERLANHEPNMSPRALRHIISPLLKVSIHLLLCGIVEMTKLTSFLSWFSLCSGL